MADRNLCEENIFDDFYKTYVQSVNNFAYDKCGNKEVSLDLVQEAFIKIWENCSKIEFTKAKSYLFTVVNNLFLNKVKHEKVVLEYSKGQSLLDVDNQNPEYILEEQQFKLKLQKAIASLSEVQREVFLLNRIEGKKYREIADLLGISQKAVEKRMSGALKTLRNTIDEL